MPLDIHLGNVLLRLPTEEIYKEFNFPEFETVVRFDKKPLPEGVPTHGISPL